MESKTAEEILDDIFYKPECRDWYKPVLKAMEEYALIKLSEKDKEIAELNQKCHDEWCSVQDLESQINEKDKEIERLKDKLNQLENLINRSIIIGNK